MNYRKTFLVEATRWHKNGDHPLDNIYRPFEDTGAIPKEPREGAIVRYFRHPQVDGNSVCKECGGIMNDHGWIDTLEGGHTVCIGDWIITGPVGEHHPCKPYIFSVTYEPA